MIVNKNVLVIICFFACVAWGQESPIVFPGVKIWRNAKKIEVEALVNAQHGVVELLATTLNGKKHESIFTLKCHPEMLHSSLLLIGLRPGNQGQYHEAPIDLYGDPVYIYIEWQEQQKQKRIKAENCIWNKKLNKPMSFTYWVFSGSRIAKNPYTEKEDYMANAEGVLVATFFDPNAIINNPLPDRVDDTVYEANFPVVPPKDSPVMVIFSAYPLEN